MGIAFELDQDIIKAACSGYPEALDQIYRITQPSVFTFIYKKVQDYELAQDLTQDVFLRAFSSLSKIQSDLKLLPWLYTIARNVCLDYWRKRNNCTIDIPLEGFSETMLDFDGVNRYTSDPLCVLKHKELHTLLAKVLAELNPQQRKALLLKDAEGMSYQEAARMTNLTSSAFTSLLYRSRIKFAQLIVSSLSPNVRVNFGYKECLSLLQWFDPLDWPDNLDKAITFKARQYFDSVAQRFKDRRPKRYPPVLDDILLARYQPHENAVGGDFGSGFGHLSARMAGRFNKVCAIDISPQMANVAKRHFEIKGLRNIDQIIGDVSKLSLPNESLDIAYCVSVLHHVLDPGECIKEMARVLKKGGKLILADFEAHKYDHVQLEHKDLWLGFNKSQLVKWLKEANFEEIWIEDNSDISFSIDIKQGEIARVPLLLAGGTKI